MKPTLLVLAAGMGSRYGGLKQMDGLGPNGETIIDYSIYDAVNAGFGKVVYIVREYFREQFEQTVKDKYSGITCPDGTPLEFDFVIQELDKIPSQFKLNPERQKPWGTALEIYVSGSLNVFNHRTNVELTNRLVCYDIKDLGKQLKKIGMLVVQDQVWGRVTENRIQGKSTRYYMDEMHLLLREDQTAAYTVEIWKRFRKWGGIPTGITQNVKDLLASKEVENIFENSDFIYMLNQAVGDRQILAKQLNISPHQLSYVTHSGEGEGLLFYGNVILPFVDRFPTNTELYRIMTTRLSEVAEAKKEQSA